MRSLFDEARAARHAAVLDEATREFTSAGVASAELSTIARRVGLTRAALYNYCSDRHDLVHQCYIRTCELIYSDLQRAALVHGRGLDKVATFVELVSDVAHPPMAVLSELGLLSDEQRKSVLAAKGQNIAALRALIAGGAADGSIRTCNVDVVSQALLGILSWAPLSRSWLNVSDDTLAQRMARTLPTVILDGVASRSVQRPAKRKRLSSVGVPQKRLSDVTMPVLTTVREKRLEEYARAGSRLFNERGIDGVTLDEVAASLGMTKGPIYNMFRSKRDFVAYCYDRAFDIYGRILDVAGNCTDGISYTRTIVELQVELHLSDVHPLWLTTGVESFPLKIRKHLASRVSAHLNRTIELTKRGIADGSLRDFDIAPAKLASVGAFAYVSQWAPFGRPISRSTLTSEIGDFLLFGLRPRD